MQSSDLKKHLRDTLASEQYGTLRYKLNAPDYSVELGAAVPELARLHDVERAAWADARAAARAVVAASAERSRVRAAQARRPDTAALEAAERAVADAEDAARAAGRAQADALREYETARVTTLAPAIADAQALVADKAHEAAVSALAELRRALKVRETAWTSVGRPEGVTSRRHPCGDWQRRAVFSTKRLVEPGETLGRLAELVDGYPVEGVVQALADADDLAAARAAGERERADAERATAIASHARN